MIIIILISIYILSIFGCRNAARLCAKHDIWLKSACGARFFWFVPIINTLGTIILNLCVWGDLQKKRNTQVVLVNGLIIKI